MRTLRGVIAHGYLQRHHKLFPGFAGVGIAPVGRGGALIEGIGLDPVGKVTVEKVKLHGAFTEYPVSKVLDEDTFLGLVHRTTEALMKAVDDLLVSALVRAKNNTLGSRVFRGFGNQFV